MALFMHSAPPTDPMLAERLDGERGASLVEYALLAALIAVVCIAVVVFLGDEVSQSFDSSGRSVHTGTS